MAILRLNGHLRKGLLLMATLREQAVSILQDVPEERMSHVVDVLKWLNSHFDSKDMNATAVSDAPSNKLTAWEEFKKYKGIIQCDIDTKAELAEARNEKYADFA